MRQSPNQVLDYSVEGRVTSSAAAVLRKLSMIREVWLRRNSASHRRSTLDPIVMRKLEE